MSLRKLLIVLFVLALVISPVNIAIAESDNVPNSSVQADINRTMVYAPLISKALKQSKGSYGIMLRQTLSRFIGIGNHAPILIALAAKASGGRRKLTNENYIGLYQIHGFGAFQMYYDELGEIVDNRYYLTLPKRNTKLAILLLDKILEEVWQPLFFYHIELIKAAERFHCTPNHYSEIIYDCDGGQQWAEDWYYNYLPLAHDAWYFQ